MRAPAAVVRDLGVPARPRDRRPSRAAAVAPGVTKRARNRPHAPAVAHGV